MHCLASIEELLYQLKDFDNIVLYLEKRIAREYEQIPILKSSTLEFASSRSSNQTSQPEAYVLAVEENTYITFLKNKVEELKQTKHNIEQAIKSLDEKEREFIELYYFKENPDWDCRRQLNIGMKAYERLKFGTQMKMIKFMDEIEASETYKNAEGV